MPWLLDWTAKLDLQPDHTAPSCGGLRRASDHRAFIDSWVGGIAASPTAVASSEPLWKLICKREWQVKESRSRFKKRAALDNWTGGSGLARLDYCWSVARRLLRDIVAGTRGAI
jgi:hypothetical protein